MSVTSETFSETYNKLTNILQSFVTIITLCCTCGEMVLIGCGIFCKRKASNISHFALFLEARTKLMEFYPNFCMKQAMFWRLNALVCCCAETSSVQL